MSAVRIVRHGELVPCRSAFIDAHTPGSDAKENFTIIGAGVSESADQYVHIRETPGFNIGAAGQPPHCFNSLHSHTTAEVFIVLSGRWRFFWGRRGDAGDVLLDEGDVFDIPTGIFRGFENVGTRYGMLLAVLGGDDAGGGVTWAPQVIDAATEHGLVLGDDGRLYDSRRGESLPAHVRPRAPLDARALDAYPELPPAAVVPRFVARVEDISALARAGCARVIGERALIDDRPGFELECLVRAEAQRRTPEVHEVLLPTRGHWRLDCAGEQHLLGPGDVCLVEPAVERALAPASRAESALFRVRGTDDPAGSTRAPSPLHANL